VAPAAVAAAAHTLAPAAHSQGLWVSFHVLKGPLLGAQRVPLGLGQVV
jgi:hypothetical protein